MATRAVAGRRRLQLAGEDGARLSVAVFEPARARHLRLSIGKDGPRLSKPAWVPWSEAVAFVESRRPWLLAQLRQANDCRHLLDLPAPLPGRQGWLTLRGTRIALRIGTAVRPWLGPDPDHHQAAGAAASGLLLQLPDCSTAERQRLAGSCLRNLVDQAMRSDCARLLQHYGAVLGRAPLRLRLRPLHSLWGSLSARDHMSLDLALVLGEPELLEYVLVHEMCHLFERNHGPRFWARVGTLLPDYATRRKRLNEQGLGLKAALAALLDYRYAAGSGGPPALEADAATAPS